MIRDITIGQYFPGKSAIHKMDPRIKILLSILYIVMLFVADNMWGLLLGVLFGFAAYLISRIPLSMIWKSMKPVVPIVIFTAVLNLFLSTGDPLWQWKFLKITREGIETAVFMSVRILCLIAGTSLLTYTTSPIALTDGIERLLSPLKKIKLPELKGSLAITVIFSIIGSFQLFNEPSIMQNMVPGNAISTYYTPNMYAYNLSFTGNQSNYAAALAIVMAIITMAIAYVVQLKSMKEQMK